MAAHDTTTAAPGQLAALLGWDGQDHLKCTDAELAAIWRHQLSTSLAADLAIQGSPLPEGIQSFSDLFQRPAAPLDLLTLAKEFSKRCDQDGKRPLPPAIASALYYCALSAALVQHRTRLSTLSDAELAKGLEWLKRQSWVDEPTRELASRASLANGSLMNRPGSLGLS